MTHLLCFGLGTSAAALARRQLAKGWRITGTSRTREGVARLQGEGFTGLIFSGRQPSTEIDAALQTATHALVSIAPEAEGDSVLEPHAADIARAPLLTWIGYLSTVGVYGDAAGQWVDESTPTAPVSIRSKSRAAAETHWLELGRRAGKGVEVFRLAGIYGPGRSALDSLADGTARRIIKPEQVFNRIHVDDIATVIEAAIAQPHPGAIYNVCDDEPAPPQDVIAFAAALMGVPAPPEIAFDDAQLSGMARSFYGECKRVSNARIKRDLGVLLAYPSYREGLTAIHGKNSGPATH